MTGFRDFDVERLHLEPGDAILLRPPADVTLEQAQAGAAELRNRYPEHVVLIVDPGWRIGPLANLGETAGALEDLLAGRSLLVRERRSLELLAKALRANLEADAREAGT
jgi:hypothetical protein